MRCPEQLAMPLQCSTQPQASYAHQSLNTTSTLELGMISTRKKGTTDSWPNTHQGSAKPIHNWVYHAAKEVGRKNYKASELNHRAMDTSKRSIQPGLHNNYTPNTRKYPIHCYIVPQAIPSILVFSKVCIEEYPTPFDPSMKFLSSLGLSSQFWASSTPKSFIPKHGCTQQQAQVLGLRKASWQTKNGIVNGEINHG